MKKEFEKIKNISKWVGNILIVFGLVNLGFFTIDIFTLSFQMSLMDLWFLSSGLLLVITGVVLYVLGKKITYKG